VNGDIFRTFFCIENNVVWLLHGLTKKTRRAPQGDLDLARRRQRGIEDGK